ncbi:unnamed protein product [Aphanomyces euteiches]
MRLLTTLALATCAIVALGRPHHEAPSRRLEEKPLKPNDWSVGYKPEAEQAETTFQYGNMHKPKDKPKNNIGSSSSRSTKQGKQLEKKSKTTFQYGNMHKPNY